MGVLRGLLDDLNTAADVSIVVSLVVIVVCVLVLWRSPLGRQ